MQKQKQYPITLLVCIAVSILLFNSCAPVPPPRSAGYSDGYGKKTIDPRFIGTWVGHDSNGYTVVATQSPDGRGRAYLRKRGKFQQRSYTWSTRGNLLEFRFGAGFPLKVTSTASRIHIGGNQSETSTYNVVSFRKRKFIARDLAKPRNVDTFYKYSDRPIYDSRLVFAWFDNGRHKVIDKQQ